MIKSNRKQRKKSFINMFRLLILITILGSLIFFAIINKTNIEKLFHLNHQLIHSKTNLYLLKYDTFDNMERAFESSTEIKNMGGAGFIKVKDERYSVYVATYPSLEKANIIKDELLKTNLHCEIETLSLENFVLKNSIDVAKHKNCLQGHLNIYLKLYKIFEEINSNSLTIVTKQKINNLLYDFKTEYDNFLTIEDKSKELNICAIYLTNLLNILENMVTFNDEYSWSIQYYLINIAFEYSNLLNALK